MLDLSAAFDTLDHKILISRLGSYFWFLRYCTTVVFILLLSCVCPLKSGHTQAVIIGKTTSNPHAVDFGILQGSTLGPLLLSLYVASFQDIVATYNLYSMF